MVSTFILNFIEASMIHNWQWILMLKISKHIRIYSQLNSIYNQPSVNGRITIHNTNLRIFHIFRKYDIAKLKYICQPFNSVKSTSNKTAPKTINAASFIVVNITQFDANSWSSSWLRFKDARNILFLFYFLLMFRH